MITLIDKTGKNRCYELDCKIPVKRQGKPEKVKAPKAKKGKKKVKCGGMRGKTTNVLNMEPYEQRANLPDHILGSKSIERAITKGSLFPRKQKPSTRKKKGAKPSSAPKGSENTGEQSTDKTSK